MKLKFILIILLISLLILTSCKTDILEKSKEEEQTSEKTLEENSKELEESKQEIKEFDMTAKQWEFTPETITVKKGDLVKLHVKSTDVTHGFALSAFGINERLSPGETIDIEFIADKTGEFKFFCSVPCGSGHSNMNGKLIVE